MLTSHYSLPPTAYDKDGRPVTVRMACGVYAPKGEVKIIADCEGRLALLFPAEREWFDYDLLTEGRSQPWPGWGAVDFDPHRALRHFVGVRDARSARDFAQRYGPLWACTRHRFPCLWRGANLPVGPSGYGPPCRWENMEPFDWWLGAAEHIRAVLSAVDRWRNGESLRPQDWQNMGWRVPEKPLGRFGEGLIISATISGYLQEYGVHITVNETLDPIIHAGLGFFPALWQEVVAIAAGAQRLAVCSNCAYPYLARQRAPKRGQRNYCPNCKQARKRSWRLSRRKKESQHGQAKG